MKTDINKKPNDFLSHWKILRLRFLFCFFLFAGRTFAQGVEEGASLGVKIGMNITSYNLTNASLKNGPGVNVGVFSNAYLAKHFALQPEINLNLQNSTISSDNELTDIKFKTVLTYIEFALSGRFYLGKVYLMAGPYISYLAHASITNKGTADEMADRNSFYDVDYGLVYSAGVQLKRWDLGLRYNDGIYKIGKATTPEGNRNIFENSKVSSFQIYAGYYF
jgi:hypothetical protein